MAVMPDHRRGPAGVACRRVDFNFPDALPAIPSAIQATPLLPCLDARGGRLTWLGSTDLGFSTLPEDEPKQ